MSCGDALVRRSMVSASVLKRFRGRLDPRAWDVLEAWVEDVATIAAMVVRRKDGKHYLAIYDASTDTLHLRPRQPEVRQA